MENAVGFIIFAMFVLWVTWDSWSLKRAPKKKPEDPIKTDPLVIATLTELQAKSDLCVTTLAVLLTTNPKGQDAIRAAVSHLMKESDRLDWEPDTLDMYRDILRNLEEQLVGK